MVWYGILWYGLIWCGSIKYTYSWVRVQENRGVTQGSRLQSYNLESMQFRGGEGGRENMGKFYIIRREVMD